MKHEEDWDFYPCRVNDAPASILVDLSWASQTPPAHANCLYVAFFDITDPGDHGMGTQGEAKRLGPIEDALFERARAVGAIPIGRLRNNGCWQVCIYGPDTLPWDAWVNEEQADTECVRKDDPNWSYYKDFLYPDKERLQWIMDRRVCDNLKQHGDQPDKPRPIDHFIYFENSIPGNFVKAVRKAGFETNPIEGGVQLVKVGPALLDEIHEDVMSLIALAEKHGGDYDGWGCVAVREKDL